MITIAVIAVALLLAGCSVASAAPLIPFVAAWTIGGVAIGTGAATVLVYGGLAAASFGASYVANKLLAKKEVLPESLPSPLSTAGAVQLNVRVGADVPQSLIVGRAVTAGSITYAGAYGSAGAGGNDRLIEIFALADHPCEALVAVFSEGLNRTLTPSGSDLIVGSGPYGGNVTMRFHDGSQTTADPVAVFAFASTANPWTEDHVGIGRTYARMSSIYAKDFVSGRLPFKFVVDGIRLYDPRKDSTVSGGSGSHRYDQLATHEWTDNIAVIIYNIARGIYVADVNGVRQFFYGMGASADQLPLDNWFAAMNECDVEIDLDGGGTEPQFTAGGEISVNTEPREAIKELLRSCGGRWSEVGGIFKLHVGAPGLPVLSITDGDLVDNGDNYRPVQPLVERVNYVTAKYTSPADGWIEAVAPALGNAEWETEDGRRLPASFDLPMVQSVTQTQRLQLQLLNRNRRGRKHSLTLFAAAFGLEPGDVFEWNSDAFGYVDKLFEVDSAAYDTLLNVHITCTEVDPTDYDWSSDYEQPQPDGLIVTARPDPKVVGGFAAASFTYSGDLGTSRPAIRLTWDDPEDGDAGGLTYEIRRTADPSDVAQYTTLDHDVIVAGQLIIVGGLQSLTEYDVRAKFISDNGYGADWSLWLTVETPDARLTSDDFYEGLHERFAGGLAADLLRLRQEIDDLSLTIADTTDTNWIDKKRVRSDLVASEGRSTAAITNEQIVRASADSALAADITSLSATVTTNYSTLNSAITTETATRASADSALAADITSLSSTVTTNYNTLNSAITTETATRASADSAISSSVTTLTSTVNGHTSSISTNATAIATIDGHLSASYAIVLDGGGHGASLKLLSTGAGSSAKLDAEQIILSGSVVADNIGAREINAGKIAIDGVDILNLIDGSATGGVSATGSNADAAMAIHTPDAAYNFTSTANVTLASVSFDAEIGTIDVDAQTAFSYSFYVLTSRKSTWFHYIETLVDGVVKATYEANIIWLDDFPSSGFSKGIVTSPGYRSVKVTGVSTSSSITALVRARTPANYYGSSAGSPGTITHSQNVVKVFERRN